MTEQEIIDYMNKKITKYIDIVHSYAEFESQYRLIRLYGDCFVDIKGILSTDNTTIQVIVDRYYDNKTDPWKRINAKYKDYTVDELLMYFINSYTKEYPHHDVRQLHKHWPMKIKNAKYENGDILLIPDGSVFPPPRKILDVDIDIKKFDESTNSDDYIIYTLTGVNNKLTQAELIQLLS